MREPHGVTRHTRIRMFDDGQHAASEGYDYTAWSPVPAPLRLVEAVIVRNGMASGAPTIDLVLEDPDGNRFVTLVTGHLFDAIDRAAQPA